MARSSSRGAPYSLAAAPNSAAREDRVWASTRPPEEDAVPSRTAPASAAPPIRRNSRRSISPGECSVHIFPPLEYPDGALLIRVLRGWDRPNAHPGERSREDVRSGTRSPPPEETSAVFAAIIEQECRKRKVSDRALPHLCRAAEIRIAVSERRQLGRELVDESLVCWRIVDAAELFWVLAQVVEFSVPVLPLYVGVVVGPEGLVGRGYVL